MTNNNINNTDNINNIIQGQKHKWEVVIGLEIHAQVNTKSKLFSPSLNSFGEDANKNVSFIDAGFPGMLPVLNEEAVTQAVKTGLGINASVNLNSAFDRKNYFYADLPQGYQISQFYTPIVQDGHLHITLGKGDVARSKLIGIERIHLEQDAGKSMHDQNPNKSYIDLNRAGVPLMEIVTRPNLNSPEEAGEFLKELRQLLRYLGTSDADMEKGNMRCDANVSVRVVGAEQLGTRNEIKNLNSITNVMKAIEIEAERQVELLENGGEVFQETRLFDPNLAETKVMRSKEDANDYRYFPCPDLYPLKLSAEFVEGIRAELPELPEEKRKRYITEFALSEYDAGVLTADKMLATYFETIINEIGDKHSTQKPKQAIKEETKQATGGVGAGKNYKLIANWLTAELLGRLNKASINIENSPVGPQALAGLINLIEGDVISGKIAKEVLDEMFATGKKPEQIVEEKGLRQVTDLGAIESIVGEVLAANGDKLVEYKNGKDKLFGFFVGQVMKASKGKANPAIVNKILQQKLNQQ